MPDAKVNLKTELNGSKPQLEKSGKSEQMCCDGKRTAAEHRSESGGTCCSDS